LTVRLIGRPRLERDGAAVASPRGAKAWALLARLVRSPPPVSRQTLVDELFEEADDPLGALRWSLAELRRRLDAPGSFTGNPVSVDLPANVMVDVVELAAGRLPSDVGDGQLLDGVDVRGSAGFELWLLVERQRVEGELVAAQRQATLRALAAGDRERAVRLAQALVRRRPDDEGSHVLLVRALATNGQRSAALAQVEASERLLRATFGADASPAIRAAAHDAVLRSEGVSPAAAARSLLEAGLAASAAGAPDVAVDRLRAAAVTAERAGDRSLRARCQLELGTALVHAVRGYDDEGAVVLRQAAEASLAAGEQVMAAKALAELGFVDVLAARRRSAELVLAEAGELAAGDDALRAAVAGFQAMNLHDGGRLEEAADRFAEAVELSRRAGAARRESWNLGLGARTLHGLGRWAEARAWARRSIELAQEERWTAFRPWPEVCLAHTRLSLGDAPGDVRRDAEETYALSRQLNDPCWESAAAEVLALTHLAEDDDEPAGRWLADATRACRSVTDFYRWLEVGILLTQAEAAARTDDRERAVALAQQALDGAAVGAMDAHLARARALLV